MTAAVRRRPEVAAVGQSPLLVLHYGVIDDSCLSTVKTLFTERHRQLKQIMNSLHNARNVN